MISIGIGFKKYPPKKINGIYGYRTKRAMSNQKAWDYSQKRFGEKSFFLGMILLAINIIWLVISINYNQILDSMTTLIYSIIQPIMLIISVILTERDLKKYID